MAANVRNASTGLYNSAARLLAPTSKVARCDAVRCRANEEESSAAEKQESTTSDSPPSRMVISDWRAAQFWDVLTWDAALPASFATGLQYAQTNAFVDVTLPSIDDAAGVLFWVLPVVLLDKAIWSSVPRKRDHTGAVDPATDSIDVVPKGLKKGLRQYRSEVRAAAKDARRRMPPVQANVARMATCMGQQFALQGIITTAFMTLVLEAEAEFPGQLPNLQVSWLPGIDMVDPILSSCIILVGAAVAMAAARIKAAERAFNPTYLERATAEFLAAPDKRLQPAKSSVLDLADILLGAPRRDGRPGRVKAVKQLDSGHVAASLTGLRLGLLATSCSLVYMQTGSILAAGWVAYMCANVEHRYIRSTL